MIQKGGRPLGEKGLEILKRLNRGTTLAMNDLFDFIASGGIGYRSRGLSGEDFKAFKRRSWQRRVAFNAAEQTSEEKQRFYKLIYRLHDHGLISKEKQGTKTIVSITQKGIEKYCILKKQFVKKIMAEQPQMMPRDYPKLHNPSSIIVSFDIPEKEKYKRAWLRSVLRNLDFKILHESVWIGNNALPKELMDDCRRMNMTKYIHIFSVLKKGTITE